MMLTFFFVMTLLMPSFGGEVKIQFTTTTMEGCKKFQRLVSKQMGLLMMRYEATECTPTTR